MLPLNQMHPDTSSTLCCVFALLCFFVKLSQGRPQGQSRNRRSSARAAHCLAPCLRTMSASHLVPVLSLTELHCAIRVLSLPSGPGSRCQSVSVSVKGTLVCLPGLGKQAHLGVSVRNERRIPGPHLTPGHAK